MRIKLNYNNPLPDEYEQLMPDDLSPIEKFEWRKHKVGELRIQGKLMVDDAGNCTFLTPMAPTDETRDESVVEKTDDMPDERTDDVVDSESDATALDPVPEIETRKRRSQSKTKTSRNNSRVVSCDYEFINNMPKQVMDTLRRLFPSSASKADLLSAAVYIISDGDCEISDKAMELVRNYNSDDKLVSINERLSHLEQTTKRQLELLQSIELCTCYNTFDRRYGSSSPRKGPKMTEFREQGNLDMLERLREQAKDQLKLDELTRGRQIYNQIKDKND